MVFVSVVSVLRPFDARAQMYELVGIRAQGMGGAFVAVADDATATWWNPAGLARGAYFSAVAEYSRPDQPTDSSIAAFSAGFPALGLSYYRLPVSQMQPPVATGGAVLIRQDQGYLSQFGATVGQSIGQVVVASTVKVLHAGDDTHVDLDLGAMVVVGRVKAGISLRNLHETDFNGDGVLALSLQRVARAGVSVTGTPGGIALTGAVDADLAAVKTMVGDERHIAGGVEAWVWNRIIGLRGGLSAETVHSLNSHSGGLSVMVLSGRYLHTYLDGQWTGGSDPMRRGWGVDLRLTF
jgi:hypothetical protein